MGSIGRFWPHRGGVRLQSFRRTSGWRILVRDPPWGEFKKSTLGYMLPRFKTIDGTNRRYLGGQKIDNSSIRRRNKANNSILLISYEKWPYFNFFDIEKSKTTSEPVSKLGKTCK